MLALRDEAANLKDAAVQKDDTITSLRQQSDVMRVELDDSKKAARAHEVRAKKQEIELANLRVCTVLHGNAPTSRGRLTRIAG